MILSKNLGGFECAFGVEGRKFKMEVETSDLFKILKVFWVAMEKIYKFHGFGFVSADTYFIRNPLLKDRTLELKKRNLRACTEWMCRTGMMNPDMLHMIWKPYTFSVRYLSQQIINI